MLIHIFIIPHQCFLPPGFVLPPNYKKSTQQACGQRGSVKFGASRLTSYRATLGDSLTLSYTRSVSLVALGRDQLPPWLQTSFTDHSPRYQPSVRKLAFQPSNFRTSIHPEQSLPVQNTAPNTTKSPLSAQRCFTTLQPAFMSSFPNCSPFISLCLFALART